MHRLIDENQFAFFKGIYILDNILISQETIHFSKQKQQSRVIVKVDFEKAYDKVHRSYLEMLEHRGFW